MEENKISQVIINMGKDRTSITPAESKVYQDRAKEIEKLVSGDEEEIKLKYFTST